MDNRIKRISKYKGQTIFGEKAKAMLVCEIRVGKNSYSFPILLDPDTGEMQGIDVALNEKYKDVLGFSYKKGVFLDNTPNFIKVYPVDRINKYKKKAQPIFSFKSPGQKISQKNLLALREKLGQKDGLLVRASLLGVDKIDHIPLSVPIYCDLEDEGAIKMFESFSTNELITSSFSKMIPYSILLQSDEGMPIFSSKIEGEDGFLKMEKSAFNKIEQKIFKIKGIPVESKTKEPVSNKTYKYQRPRKKAMEVTKDIRTEISSIYEKYALSESVFKGEIAPKGESNSREKIRNVFRRVNAESPNALYILYYTLRELQKKFMYKVDPLFGPEEILWKNDTQEEKIYGPKEILFRKFSLWTLAYAKQDAEKNIPFSDKNYENFKKSFIYIQSLPTEIPDKDFKINISFVLKNKLFTENSGEMKKKLTKQGWSYVNSIINSLKPIFGESLEWKEHEYDPSTDKFYYAEILIEGKKISKEIDSSFRNKKAIPLSRIISELEESLLSDVVKPESAQKEVVDKDKGIPSALAEENNNPNVEKHEVATLKQ